jgi:hypothetical protein
VARPGTLARGSTTTLTLTAEDAAGNPVGRATVYLKLTDAPDSHATIAITTPGCTAVPRHPDIHKCRTDKIGQITVDYKTSTSTPTGTDAIGATLQAITTTNPYPTWTWDTYTYKRGPSLDQLQWSPSPLAVAGSLAAGQVVNATVTATGKAGKPVGGAKVYLWFQRGSSRGDNATATCGSSQQSLPGYCTADSKGVINVTYTSTTRPKHILQPLRGGTDTLFAALDPGGTKLATDSYSYLAQPRSAVTEFLWSPSPVARPGTLAPGATTVLTLTADDATGNPVDRATVYLELTPAPGSAATIDITTPGCTIIKGHPGILKCQTDKIGQITVDYRTPPTTPVGTDAIGVSASNPATNRYPTWTWDTYKYG